VIRCALLCLLALLLGGCYTTTTRNAYRVQGTAVGQPVDVVVEGGSSADAGVDVGAAVSGALAAVRGDVKGIMEAMASKMPPPVDVKGIMDAIATRPPPPPVDNTALYATGGTAIAALLAAWLKSQSDAKAHKADADEAWDRLAPPTTPKA